MKFKQNTVVFATLFCLYACSSSLAQSWDNEVGDADWFSQTNWDADLLPDGTQDVIVDTTGETVLVTDQDPDATAQAKDLTLGSTAGANGELTITSSGLAQTTGDIILALGADSTATLIVTGSGSTLTAGGSFAIGAYGSGMLRVENGGMVSANGDSYIGYTGDAVGEVTISGAGSTWNNASGQIGVGYAGTGTLTVEDGGMVTSLFASVGSTLGGVGTARVTGENSQWQNTKTFLVGNACFLMVLL